VGWACGKAYGEDEEGWLGHVYMYLREHGDEYPDIIEVDLNSL
jgi:hypothetical protein